MIKEKMLSTCKACRICKQEKELKKFATDPRMKNGRRNECINCRDSIKRKWESDRKKRKGKLFDVDAEMRYYRHDAVAKLRLIK